MKHGEQFLGGRVVLHCGDCLDVMKTFAPDSIDSVCCDPPYHLTSIVKRFGATSQSDDTQTSDRSRRGADGYARLATGFMGRKWDGGDIAFRAETWAEVLRVMKPGAHLVACGGTRTYHRLACAIEDAGFEIRDCIQWLYASGFPKSHDVSKGIDRAAGAEREVLRTEKFRDIRNGHGRGLGDGINAAARDGPEYLQHAITAPATDAAREWSGFGTALKPACEMIVLARKPLGEATVAANVLRWGTGALNIDGCRVAADEPITTHSRGSNGAFPKRPTETSAQESGRITDQRDGLDTVTTRNGRWPANVIHDGSDEVVAAFPETQATGRPNCVGKSYSTIGRKVFGTDGEQPLESCFLDSGSAARFFYTAKADSDDRIGSRHPTIKPLALMQYLVRLITPPRGVCLDLFAGTGTTGEAAYREGMSAILIEREPEYQADIRRRMALVMSGPDERARESIKAKLKDKPPDHGPLFAFREAAE